MKIKNVLSIGLVLLPCFASAQQTFVDAMRIYEAGDFADARIRFERLAQLGQHDAQHNLGIMYYQGHGVEKDYLEAYAWVSLAAESGDASFIKTRDVIKEQINPTVIHLALERAGELRNRYGMGALNMSLLPELVKVDIPYCDIKQLIFKSPQYPKKAVQARQEGWVDIEFSIAKDGSVRDMQVIEEVPKGVFSKSVYTAVKKYQYEPPLINGKPVEIDGFRIRVMFSIAGEISDEYKKKASKFADDLLEKAKLGSPGHQYTYAYFMSSHSAMRGTLEPNEINAWYLKAAKSGLKEAQYRIGWSLLYGQGCTADNSKAIEWLTKAAQSDYPNAQVLLANALLYIVNKNPDYLDKAIFWLNNAADQKYMPAQIKLAWLLSTNHNEKYRDGKRAVKLIEAAEDYPDEATMYEVYAAVLAETGDYKQAFKKQEKAIDLAEDLGWDLTPLQARLAAYEQGKPWRE